MKNFIMIWLLSLLFAVAGVANATDAMTSRYVKKFLCA
jgi:hypothetical protein